MLVKTFKAADMPEALRLVKAEFGADAMILSSRQERRRGILGRFARPVCEVTAALGPSLRMAPAPLPESAPEETSAFDAFQRSMLAPLARELKELRARVENLSAREGEGGAPGKRAGNGMAEPRKVVLRTVPGPDPAPWEEGTRQEPAPHSSRPRLLEVLAAELRASGVGDEESRTLMNPLVGPALRGAGESRLRELLKDSVAASIHCAGPFRVKKNATRILALVGPTGVGKTTTIAKLAAIAGKQGVRVALITVDTFRVGAVEQLQTYSGIMGVPLEVAATPAELAAAIARHSDKQLVFIDTAGRSPRDRERLLEMNGFLEVHPDIETHLCLSATTRDGDLARIVERFGVLPVSQLIFTKLDESESFGCIVNVHLREKLPLSYFTTGQRVPEDIEAASAARVAGLLVRETTP